MEQALAFHGFEDVEAGIVKWPMSVIRIRSEKTERLVDLADHILKTWRGYSDEAAYLFAETDGEPHNTITPIARFRDGKYELDLVLRNNITTPERPLGVYHPNPSLHHIKKENIGLIEVMGLAVLPARLKDEMALLGEYIVEERRSVRRSPSRSTRTGPRNFFPSILRLRRRISWRSSGRRSGMCSPRSWRMREFIRGRLRGGPLSCGLPMQ